jgi:glycosyltransferase involved in cell wall biosynthesis
MWEEPFGLVFVETMASGTPIIAFARGAVPEVIVDGVTGFIINPSDEDIRGKWIIKKTGLDGLCEAVERIYSLSKDDYGKMREACRAHVENNFTMERMVKEYESVYSKLISEQKNSL